MKTLLRVLCRLGMHNWTWHYDTLPFTSCTRCGCFNIRNWSRRMLLLASLVLVAMNCTTQTIYLPDGRVMFCQTCVNVTTYY
jgi:hypothetical protein